MADQPAMPCTVQFENRLAGSGDTPRGLNTALDHIKEQQDTTAEGTTMKIFAAIAISLCMLASGEQSQTGAIMQNQEPGMGNLKFSDSGLQEQIL